MDQSLKLTIAFLTVLFCSNISAKEKVNFESLAPISAQQQMPFDIELKNEEESRHILLQFWASWCHSCSGFMYDLDKIASETQAPYYAISTDDDIEKAEKYLSTHSLFKQHQSRFWFDSEAKLKNFYNIEAVPSVVIIDTHGETVWRATGHLNSKDLLKLRQLLSKKIIIQNQKEV